MILVTGGAGFIGSNLVAGLEAAGVGPIVVCDRLGDGDKWRNLAKRRLEDIVQPDELLPWLERAGDRVRCVFHLGAISATTARDADAVIRANVRLSQRLWRWCADQETPLIYASSAAVYGDGAHGFGDDESDASMSQLRPQNLYGWSKLLFDRWVLQARSDGRAAPPQSAGLRFFNVYGPNEYHKGAQQSVVPVLNRQIADTGVARLFRSARPDIADGDQRRDFVYVDDCVDVMLWLFRNPQVSGIYNVGSGSARRFKDLAAAVFRARGLAPAIEYIDMPEGLQAHYQYFTEARMDRLRAAGYDQAPTSLEEGVTRYIEDYLSTADPYR